MWVKKGKRDDRHHKTEWESLLEKTKKMYRIIRLFTGVFVTSF